ncbi:unnamed protein product [Spirodela intermedia]|uniref:IBH1-like N-terminal domain-containing protein n=2 Tax=Spirodela intermedia TaxID=51605 RepID=A0A7I8JLI4_SPIIN|nr:unnamed protein product [Spirodela intermedia]CAA6671036.1 unnamed protein product [Spirodela intermedia]CAA7408141.1 unnamed protein product [Spirodela intermedia]
MQSAVSFKVAFLRYLQAGLDQVAGVPSANASVMERKRAIKLTADMAMALARGGRRWSRALMSNLCKQGTSENLPRTKFPLTIFSRKKILRRRFRQRPSPPRTAAAASLLARRMMKKRTEVLKRLVPGGNSMDDFSLLLDEALDYVLSLRAQADLLRRLTYAIEHSKCRWVRIYRVKPLSPW